MLAMAVRQPTYLWLDGRNRQQAGSYKDWVRTVQIVGASLLAMDVNDEMGRLEECGVWAFFASKLAPTGIECAFDGAPLSVVSCKKTHA